MAQTIRCPHCAVDFVAPRSDSTFCSRTCYSKARYQKTYASRNGVKYARKQSVPASENASMREIGWAAGFLEGEGNFGLNHRALGKSASQVVRATQKNLEPLFRLQRSFGGSVKQARSDGYGEWRAYGVRARGIMQTLYTLLSAEKRADVRLALEGGY